MNAAEKQQIYTFLEKAAYTVYGMPPSGFGETPLFAEWEVFKALTHTAGLFEQVRVDAHGYGVC